MGIYQIMFKLFVVDSFLFCSYIFYFYFYFWRTYFILKPLFLFMEQTLTARNSMGKCQILMKIWGNCVPLCEVLHCVLTLKLMVWSKSLVLTTLGHNYEAPVCKFLSHWVDGVCMSLGPRWEHPTTILQLIPTLTSRLHNCNPNPNASYLFACAACM